MSWRRVERSADRLAGAALALSAGGLVLITGIIFAAVVARYVLLSPLAGAEQAALVVMLWMVLLGAAAGVHQGFHIRLTAGLAAMTPTLRRLSEMLAEAMVLAFGLLMLASGIELVQLTAGHALPGLPFSRGEAYVALPLSGALMALFAALRLVALLGRRRRT